MMQLRDSDAGSTSFRLGCARRTAYLRSTHDRTNLTMQDLSALSQLRLVAIPRLAAGRALARRGDAVDLGTDASVVHQGTGPHHHGRKHARLHRRTMRSSSRPGVMHGFEVGAASLWHRCILWPRLRCYPACAAAAPAHPRCPVASGDQPDPRVDPARDGQHAARRMTARRGITSGCSGSGWNGRRHARARSAAPGCDPRLVARYASLLERDFRSGRVWPLMQRRWGSRRPI